MLAWEHAALLKDKHKDMQVVSLLVPSGSFLQAPLLWLASKVYPAAKW